MHVRKIRLCSVILMFFFLLKKVKSSHQHVRKQNYTPKKKKVNHQNTFIVS